MCVVCLNSIKVVLCFWLLREDNCSENKGKQLQRKTKKKKAKKENSTSDDKRKRRRKVVEDEVEDVEELAEKEEVLVHENDEINVSSVRNCLNLVLKHLEVS